MRLSQPAGQGLRILVLVCEDAPMAEQEVLYRSRAALYDVIYQWKDYQSEASRVRELLHEQGIADGSRVLEAACGTGAYLQRLRSWFEVSGFDLYEEMVTIAREKLGLGVPVFAADMTSFTVEQPQDALLCLFSSIGYVYPVERLQAAARCFAEALRPGGVLIVEPWIDPANFTAGYVEMQMESTHRIKACRAAHSTKEGELAILDFQWLVVDRQRKSVNHFTERHCLWLCPRDTMQQAFEDAGFDCRYEPDGLMPGRGLIIGRRQ